MSKETVQQNHDWSFNNLQKSKPTIEKEREIRKLKKWEIINLELTGIDRDGQYPDQTEGFCRILNQIDGVEIIGSMESYS